MPPRTCGTRRCAVLCVIFLFLTTQVWHKIACHVFVQTCSPIGLGRLALVFFNLDRMPSTGDRTTSSGVVAAAQGDDTSQCTPMWEPHEPRWAILLASPKSGSTYVQQMLNSHPKIWCAPRLTQIDCHTRFRTGHNTIFFFCSGRFGRERILEAYRNCRVRTEGHCSWPETQDKLEEAFKDYRRQAWYDGRKVVGFKIQYDHVAPELRPDFSRWLACNQIDVLHLSRGAVVESFWTLQVGSWFLARNGFISLCLVYLCSQTLTMVYAGRGAG
jgi:hypothetical protein